MRIHQLMLWDVHIIIFINKDGPFSLTNTSTEGSNIVNFGFVFKVKQYNNLITGEIQIILFILVSYVLEPAYIGLKIQSSLRVLEGLIGSLLFFFFLFEKNFFRQGSRQRCSKCSLPKYNVSFTRFSFF